LRKRSRDALQKEEEKEKDATAHKAIFSAADWKAQKFGKGRKTPRQELHGTSVRCRECTGPHPNAYCLRCSNEEGKPYGICGSKTGRSCIEKHQEPVRLRVNYYSEH
jgi:hypothetical protein